jgi:hypothetical protein
MRLGLITKMVNIKRGDTFYVHEDKFRGTHFTCVGQHNNGFYAGDTEGRMYSFQQAAGYKYRVKSLSGPSSGRNGPFINAEAIISE